MSLLPTVGAYGMMIPSGSILSYVLYPPSVFSDLVYTLTQRSAMRTLRTAWNLLVLPVAAWLPSRYRLLRVLQSFSSKIPASCPVRFLAWSRTGAEPGRFGTTTTTTLRGCTQGVRPTPHPYEAPPPAPNLSCCPHEEPSGRAPTHSLPPKPPRQRHTRGGAFISLGPLATIFFLRTDLQLQ